MIIPFKERWFNKASLEEVLEDCSGHERYRGLVFIRDKFDLANYEIALRNSFLGDPRIEIVSSETKVTLSMMDGGKITAVVCGEDDSYEKRCHSAQYFHCSPLSGSIIPEDYIENPGTTPFYMNLQDEESFSEESPELDAFLSQFCTVRKETR